MLKQGDNPEAVQQKDRVKGKKHLNSKIRTVEITLNLLSHNGDRSSEAVLRAE